MAINYWAIEDIFGLGSKNKLHKVVMQSGNPFLSFNIFSPCEGDFDHDGDVDGSDLAVFARDVGRTYCPH
jgi:hypothetical protein